MSHVAVLKAIKAGRIEKEPDGTIDLAKADAAWQTNTDPAQQRTPAAPSSPEPSALAGPSFAQSRAIREAYNARLSKLAYEEKAGELVRTDAVKVAWFNILRVLRDRTLNLPDRLAPILAAEPDPKQITALLDDELRQILDDVADTLPKLTNTRD